MDSAAWAVARELTLEISAISKRWDGDIQRIPIRVELKCREHRYQYAAYEEVES
jgi:hypothetical protein